MQIITLASMVVRRWWLVLPLAVAGLVAAYLWNTSQPIRYESTVTLQLNPTATGGLLPFQTEGGNQINEVTALGAAYAELLRSRAFGELVVEQLQLELTPEAVAGATRARLVPNTNLLRLSVTMDTPIEAQQLAQGIADVFIAENARRQQVTPAQARLTELDRLVGLYREQVELTRARQDELSRAVAAGDLSKTAELNTVESRLRGLEDTYSSLLVEASRARSSFENAVIVDRASTARAVGPPPLYQSLLIGLLGALAAGVALAMFLEQLDNRLRVPEQVALLLEGSPIGTIGRISTRRWPKETRPSRLVTLHAERSAGAEAFRTIRTNLRFAAPDQKLHSLLVTSAGPGEGKTFVASNLAIAFAQGGRRVLLVDADLRRPSVHSVFGLPQQPGLMDLLLRHLDAPGRAAASVPGVGSLLPDGSVKVGSIPNLAILPAGALPRNPDLVLGSEAIASVIAQLEQRYDLVIVDSAPLGPVADSLLLAVHLDGALLVARSNQTRRADLQRALDALGQTACPVLGIVLNDLRLGLIDRYTSEAYYTYGKQYYGQPLEAAEQRNGHAEQPAAALARGKDASHSQ